MAAKLTKEQQIEFGLIGVNNSKYKGIVTEQKDKQARDRRNAETDLQNIICKWLSEKHVMFLSDFAAGLHLSPFLANIRSMQSCEYKMPDLYIFMSPKPLIIEIKVKESDLFLSDGKTLKSEHVQLQYESLLKLRKLGCHADFGVGEYDIKTMITQYESGSLQYKTILPLRQLTKFQKSDLLADQFFDRNK